MGKSLRGMLLAWCAALLLGSQPAQAASGPAMGPSQSWDEMQKFEYYIGQMGSALNICGNYSLATGLRKLANLTPYGRKGWDSMLVYDQILGAQCGRLANDAKDILTDGDKIEAYLRDKYHCEGASCDR